MNIMYCKNVKYNVTNKYKKYIYRCMECTADALQTRTHLPSIILPEKAL